MRGHRSRPYDRRIKSKGEKRMNHSHMAAGVLVSVLCAIAALSAAAEDTDIDAGGLFPFSMRTSVEGSCFTTVAKNTPENALLIAAAYSDGRLTETVMLDKNGGTYTPAKACDTVKVFALDAAMKPLAENYVLRQDFIGSEAEEAAKVEKARRLLPTAAQLESHAPMNLWHEGEAPYQLEGREDNAVILPYLVEGASQAVVIFPGGGYVQLSSKNEGTAVAEAYNQKGVSAFVVKYRCQPYGGDAILADGMRAVQYVRYFAEEFGIDPDKIAVLGFSAGGHLATMVCQHAPQSNLAGDAIGETCAVPDALLLGYPVTTLGDGTYETMPGVFLGSEKNNAARIAEYSYPYNIAAMPPTFIFYSKLDTFVDPAKNAAALAALMKRSGKTVELHAYADGGHGVGLGTEYAAYSEWLDASVSFLAP